MNNIIGNITGIKRTRSAPAPAHAPVQKAPKKSNSRKKPRQDILITRSQPTKSHSRKKTRQDILTTQSQPTKSNTRKSRTQNIQIRENIPAQKLTKKSSQKTSANARRAQKSERIAQKSARRAQKSARRAQKSTKLGVLEEKDEENNTELPTESKIMILLLLGMNLEEIQTKMATVEGKYFDKYRDIVEILTPTSQGNYARQVSQIVLRDKSDKYSRQTKDQARFILNYFGNGNDDEICYICKCKIEKKPNCNELEHFLPVAQGLYANCIITEKPNADTLEDDTAYRYLLEYFPSHTCCNQMKGSLTFLKLREKGFVFDEVCARDLLKDIWINTVGGGNKRDENYSCGNEFLREQLRQRYMKGKKTLMRDAMSDAMNNFINERLNDIRDNFANKISKNLQEVINKKANGNIEFAKMLFLSNQAMSMDQRVFAALGIKSPKIPKQQFMEEVIVQLAISRYKDYYNDIISPCIEKIIRLFGEDKIKDYFTKKNKGRYTPGKFKLALYSDFLKLKTFHEGYLINRKKSVTITRGPFINLENYYDNQNFFAIEYIYYLLLIQNDEYHFTESMKKNIIKMAINVNDYTMIYLMCFIIIYCPFNDDMGVKIKIDAVAESDRDVHKLISESVEIDNDSIHREYVTGEFQFFNYYLYLQDMEYIPQYLTLSNISELAKRITITLFENGFDDLYKVLLSLKKTDDITVIKDIENKLLE